MSGSCRAMLVDGSGPRISVKPCGLLGRVLAYTTDGRGVWLCPSHLEDLNATRTIVVIPDEDPTKSPLARVMLDQ